MGLPLQVCPGSDSNLPTDYLAPCNAGFDREQVGIERIEAFSGILSLLFPLFVGLFVTILGGF